MTDQRKREGQAREPILQRDFVLVTVSVLFWFSGHIIFLPTLPTYIRRLGGAESDVGVLVAATAFTALVLRPLAGYLVDRFGSRQMSMYGGALYIFVALGYHLADSEGKLMVVRIMTGVAISLYFTATNTYVAHVAPPARRAEALGYFGLGPNLAFAVIPLLAIIVMDASWLRGADEALTDRATWLAGASVGPENFTLVFFFAAFLTIMGTGLVALTKAVDAPHDEVGRGLGRPSQWFAMSAAFPTAINFTQAFAFSTVITFVVLLARDRGFGGSGSYFFLVYAIAIISTRLVAGRIADRYGRGMTIVPGLALIAIAMVVVGFADQAAFFLAGAALFGVGSGAAQPALMALTVDHATPAERGRAMGTFALSADLGISAGALILGFILERTNYETTFIVAASVVVIGMAGYVLGSPVINARRRQRLESSETASVL